MFSPCRGLFMEGDALFTLPIRLVQQPLPERYLNVKII